VSKAPLHHPPLGGIVPDRDARLRVTGMLLVGSAARNSGKTTLACALVESLARHQPVAAVKVTIVRHGNGCPRGDEGCGLCESLDVPFRIIEETDPTAKSDTARLLAAGARPVLWLCARPETLPDAVRALREVVEPDLFVIVRRRATAAAKPSARAVWDLADAIVESDLGAPDRVEFQPAVTDFGFSAAGWTLRRQASGIVLAGGLSSRMRRDKSLLPLEGRPLIAHVVGELRSHVDEVLVSANDGAKYAFLGLPVIADREPGHGPMMAVASTLEHTRHDTVLYSPCDVPRAPAALVARLFRAARAGGDVIVPISPNGRYESLFAIYRRSALPELRRALEAGERRIIRIYDRCDTRVVPVGPGEGLFNINTAADYEVLLGDPTTPAC
jgi:molybdopterin-guanine dinucleotide biosynthesis protein A